MTASFVTDGGLETDLIFHRGVDLPDFAAFPLLDDPNGVALLELYFEDYARIAAGATAGLLLEAPTWRASADWGDRLGYDAAALARVNTAAVDLLARIRDRWAARIAEIRIGGSVGPRGDGYSAASAPSADEAAEYHAPQLAAFAAAGADLATAYTLTDVGEAIGVVRAARAAGIPVGISFTVETDGRLPSGATLAEAVAAVDAAAPPDHFGVNCAHPTHLARGLDGGDWQRRITVVRANASTKSHAELDEAEELDEGDPAEFAAAHDALRAQLPALSALGGCCGTDARHVAAVWAGGADG